MYEEYIREKEDLIEWLRELKDIKELGCWCSPEKCHGEVIIKLYNYFFEDNKKSKQGISKDEEAKIAKDDKENTIVSKNDKKSKGII